MKKTDPPPLPHQIGSLVYCSHIVRVTTLLRVDALCDQRVFKVHLIRPLSIYIYLVRPLSNYIS